MSAFEVGIDAFAVVAEGVEPDLKHFDPEGELPDGSWVYSKVESSFGRDSPRWWWAFYHPEGDDSLPESYEDSDVLFRIFDWAKRRTGFREFAEAVEKTENQIGFLGAAYTLAERQGLSVEEFRELDRLRDEWLQARVDAQQDTRRHGRYSAPSPEDPATLPDEVEDPTPPPVDAEKVAEVSDAYSSLPDDSTGAAGAPE